jgi:sugar phosphate isomerase/epimerase
VPAELGLFLSTLRIADLAEACRLARGLGFRVVQIGRLRDEQLTPAGVDRLGAALAGEGLVAEALTAVFEGESYADVEAVRRTVGFLPEATTEARVRHCRRLVDAAAALGIGLVTTHVGFLPSDRSDPDYERVRRATGEVAAYAAGRGVRLGLETGQETADELLAFLERLGAPAWVNFDGANFVAYGMGDPLAALELLYPRTVGVHVKDYHPQSDPSQLGRPCPLGQGAARVDDTIRWLLAHGWTRPLLIETYHDVDPPARVAEAREYLGRLVASVSD